MCILEVTKAVEAVQSRNFHSWRSNREGGRMSREVNVSKVIEGLLEGYDIRLRPQFGGKK